MAKRIRSLSREQARRRWHMVRVDHLEDPCDRVAAAVDYLRADMRALPTDVAAHIGDSTIEALLNMVEIAEDARLETHPRGYRDWQRSWREDVADLA